MRFILLIIMILSSEVLHAGVDLGGQIHFIHQSETHPTGQRGTNAFQLGALIIEGQADLENQNFVVLRYRTHQEELDGVSNQRPHPSSRAFIQFGTFANIGEVTEVGLIGNPVNEWSRSNWGQDQMGFMGYSFADRYGYFTDSDWGLGYRQQLLGGEWGLRLINGNAWGQSEEGFHKDVQISSQLEFSEKIQLAASLIYGGYEQYSSTLAVKERAWVLVKYMMRPETQVSLEAFLSRDPANEVSEKWAESVDLTSYLGSRVYGEGLSVQIAQQINALWLGFFRFDEISPAKNKDSQQKLQLFSIGGSKNLQTQLSFLWAYEYLKLPQSYYQGARDQGRFVLAVAAYF